MTSCNPLPKHSVVDDHAKKLTVRLKLAIDVMPPSDRITCSAVKGSQLFNLIWPCTRRRTADASGVPGAIAWVK